MTNFQPATASRTNKEVSVKTPSAPNGNIAHQVRSLHESVEIAVDNYFSHLDGQHVTGVYDLVLQEVEAPLLEAVMKYTRNNQSRASEVLGLNRGTLRKKLKRYGLL